MGTIGLNRLGCGIMDVVVLIDKRLAVACEPEPKKERMKMDRADRISIVAIPSVVLVAAIVAWAGSQGGYAVAGIPLFALCVALAFIIQWAAFIPAFLKQTEAFYDLTGSITYVTVMLVAVALSEEVDARSLLLLGMVAVWAIRLGTFLFRRIRAEGKDRRFDAIKPSFPRFLLTWTVQGLWVSLTLAAALATITSETKLSLGVFAVVGFAVWVMGFGIEVIADRQKSQFRAAPENAGKFINVGLWSWSRHPNYFGEIVLWVGVAIIALPVLRGWQWLTLISPLFVTLLLTRVSGLPMLEKRADEKWGGQPEYEAYKARTPVLVPRPPRGR
jgi:steroid 5-alpha reductase family enzyme